MLPPIPPGTGETGMVNTWWCRRCEGVPGDVSLQENKEKRLKLPTSFKQIAKLELKLQRFVGLEQGLPQLKKIT
jgi:hypothetical protein